MASPWHDGQKTCVKDTGGSCTFLNCFASRGPTDCVDTHCMCKEGFCADAGVCHPAPTSTVALAGNTTNINAESMDNALSKAPSWKALDAKMKVTTFVVLVGLTTAFGAVVILFRKLHRNTGDDSYMEFLDGATAHQHK